MNRAFTLLAAAALASAFALPARAERESPPPPGPPQPFVLADLQNVELPNGLAITFIPFGTVPKVTISAVVRTGALNQGGKIWLSSLATELMKQGTQQRNAEQIAESAALMGGALGAQAGDDETSFGLDVLSESAPDAVKLLAEVMLQPALPESELARLKQDFQRTLSVQLSSPQTLADVAFSKLLFPNHPYGDEVPTPEQLAGYTLEDVRQYYTGNFGAQRTHIYVAGQFDRALIEGAIREQFGSWARGPAPLIAPPQAPNVVETKLIDRPGAPQSTVRLGTRVIDPTQADFMPLSVANTLLGGILTSRITMNLREQKGWAYSPASALSPKYRTGVWLEAADVQTANTGPSLSEIKKEIARLASEPPSAVELDAIKRYRHGMFVLSNSTRGGIIGQVAFMHLHGLPREWLTTFIDRLYAVTPEQVRAATLEYLKADRMTVVIVGDLAKVKPQLARK
ncbi:MAG: pitrilysin family protein [Steroidobacteraceae bacterium]